MHRILFLFISIFIPLNSMELEMEDLFIPDHLNSKMCKNLLNDTEQSIPKKLFMELPIGNYQSKKCLLEILSAKNPAHLVDEIQNREIPPLLEAAFYIEANEVKNACIEKMTRLDHCADTQMLFQTDQLNDYQDLIQEIRAQFLTKHGHRLGALFANMIDIIDCPKSAEKSSLINNNDSWSCMFGFSRQQTVLKKNALLIDLSCMNIKIHELPCCCPNEDDSQIVVGSSSGIYLFDACANKLIKKLQSTMAPIKRFEKIDYDHIKKTYLCHYELEYSDEGILIEIQPSGVKANHVCSDVKNFKKQRSGRLLGILKNSLEITLYHLDHQYTITIDYPLLGKHLNPWIDFDKQEEKLIVGHPNEKSKAIKLDELYKLDRFICTKISPAQMGLIAKSLLFNRSVDLAQDIKLKTAFTELPDRLKEVLTQQFRVRAQKTNTITQLKDIVLDLYHQ